MPRRVDLPGAAELFRSTGSKPAFDAGAAQPAPMTGEDGSGRTPRSSGRVRHEEKITVYVSSEELLALEQLRLDLRARHGVAVDRGRIVRAAIAESLADVLEHGAESSLVRRLTQP